MKENTKTFLYEKNFTVLFSLFYIFGVLGCFYNHEILCAFIAFIILSFLILFFNYDKKKIIILYLIFFVGFIRVNLTNNNDMLKGINCSDATIKGKIISPKNISYKNHKIKFYIKTNEAEIFNKTFSNLNSKILVSLDYEKNLENIIKIGNEVKIKGKLRTPKQATNPYQFDYRKYLSNNDCYSVFYSNNEIQLIKASKFNHHLENNWYHILNNFENIREKIIKQHSKNIKSPNLEVLGGIVFGNETINRDENIKENFKNSGLLHLLAASGLNVALIYGIWWWIASLIKLPYKLSILTGGAFVVLYTFMTGFPPSILRASLMLLFILFGKLIDKDADSVALISFVGFLILLFNPKMFFDIGFQLSFVVTFGLIVCCPVIIDKFKKQDEKFKGKHKNKTRLEKYILFLFSPINIASLISVPLVAQLWVIPLQMHYFNNLAPLSILANITVVPFIGILSFIGFLSSILALIPKISNISTAIFDFIANPLISLLVKISEFFSSFKFSLIATMGFNIFQILSFWILILLFMLNLKNNFRKKKHIIVLIFCIFVFLLSFIKPSQFQNNLEITMFDVENADCFLIKTPKNKYIMIDTGKIIFQSTNSAQNVILPYFRNERIKSLEILEITHFDSDHCGGALDLLKNIKIKKVIIQKEQTKSKISSKIMEYIKNKSINYSTAKNNDLIYEEKDLKIKTFRANFNKNNDKYDNEESIITLMTYKNKNYLFMADCGIEGFNKIKPYIKGNIEILKIGHHGAKNVINKSMLKKLKPKYALISTGLNKFNHPHYSTIILLSENEINTISTKNYGFSKIIINKNLETNFKHYDKETHSIKNILFNKKDELPFHKSNFVQNLIKENS